MSENQNLVTRLDNLTPTIFAQEIEKIVKDSHLNYIQAILYYCEKFGMDIEAVPQFLNSTIKQKIQLDAETLHFLPKSSKLPI